MSSVCLAEVTAAPADLLRGATWQYSTDGKVFSDQPPVAQPGKRASLTAQLSFDVEDTTGMVCLELTHNLPVSSKRRILLNGEVLSGPMRRMVYRTIPAVDPSVLKRGRNLLAISWVMTSASAEPLTIEASLKALRPEHLAIQTGPILGAMGDDFFAVTCRTNMPATLSVRCARGSLKPKDAGKAVRIASGPAGLVHRGKVKVAGPGLYEYEIIASCRRTTRSLAKGQVNLPASAGPLRLVMMGDSRTNPDRWARVAQAVLRQEPALVVFGGDMVANGRHDWRWDEEFFAPAKELFARIPTYAVIGNHEGQAPLYYEVFWTPSKDGRSPNWSQQIGRVLLIGIDGTRGWSPDSKNAKWLDETLAGSKADFVFLATHYPAWTSGGHGKLDESGQVRERALRQSRQTVWPLLVKHKAAAMFAGHDHIYERSDPPGGVTHITTGGAGAPSYGKADDAARQNPYSKVFASKLHYCLLDVAGDTCTMKVITPEGEVIDQCTWRSRAVR